MDRFKTAFMMVGWISFFYLAFCGADREPPESDVPGEMISKADASEPDGPDETDWSPSVSGGAGVYVVDAVGKTAGLLISRTHTQFDGSELYDAVQVYNPEYGLFFSVSMNTAQVIRPAKIVFSKSNCTGSVGIRATCQDCTSGHDLAFEHNGSWYEVEGGVSREQKYYSSYLPEEAAGNCTAHGSSTTYVFPVKPLGPPQSPGSFAAPMEFFYATE